MREKTIDMKRKEPTQLITAPAGKARPDEQNLITGGRFPEQKNPIYVDCKG